MSKATESMFDGKHVLIPLAEVCYVLKFQNCIEVRFKDSTEPLTLVQPDKNAFISAWCRYRGEVEADTLMDLDGAQPTPSVPEGWLRAIDEALVVAYIGVVNANDAYEQAKAKLDIYRESLPCYSSKDKNFEEALNCWNFKASEQKEYAAINHRAVADAYLRAAAPDLLDELLSVLDWAVTERAPLREQEIESIRKVIAKATGEQP